MGESLQQYVQRRVVLDTDTPTIYIGTLLEVDEYGYWLGDADVHDRNDGHSTKEEYINEACTLERSGNRRTNRSKVFVERRAVISISALSEVVASDDAEAEAW